MVIDDPSYYLLKNVVKYIYNHTNTYLEAILITII